MKKKFLSVLLCTAMTVSLLSGCGNSETNSKTSESSEKKESTVTSSSVATSESVASSEESTPGDVAYPLTDEEITFTGLVTSLQGTNLESRAIWDKVEEITGVNFEWIVLDGEAVSVYLAAGEWEFDFVYDKLTDAQILDYGVLGEKFIDYNDYLEYMPNLQKVMENYPETKKIIAESNGAIYRLPRVAKDATLNNTRTHYNVDMLKEVGLTGEDIKTVDDFYNALKLLKEKNGHPGWNPNKMNEKSTWPSAIFSAFGTSNTPDFDDDGNGNVIYNRTSEQYKHYLEFMNKLYEEELIYQEYITSDNNLAKSQAMDGLTAFYGSEASSLKPEHFSSGTVALSCLPPLTSEYDSTQEFYGRSPVSIGGCQINAECENIELLCQVLDIAYAEEEVVEGSGLAGVSFTYGILGKDLILNGDTFSQVPGEGYDNFATYQGEVLNWSTSVPFGLCTALDGLVTDVPGNNQARQAAYTEFVNPYMEPSAEMFPEDWLKFSIDENSDLQMLKADVVARVNEMKDKFITGVADIETEWDDYVQSLYDRGLQEVLDFYQAAYDRWNEME